MLNSVRQNYKRPLHDDLENERSSINFYSKSNDAQFESEMYQIMSKNDLSLRNSLNLSNYKRKLRDYFQSL